MKSALLFWSDYINAIYSSKIQTIYKSMRATVNILVVKFSCIHNNPGKPRASLDVKL